MKLFTVYHPENDVSIVLGAEDSEGAEAAGLLALRQVDPANHLGLVASQLRVVEHPQGFVAVWQD